MSVIIWSIVAYLTNRPKKQPIFWSILAKTGDRPKFFRLFWSIKGAAMRDKRQHCDAISPLNDTHATLSRQFGDIVAGVSHWEYRDKSRFPSFSRVIWQPHKFTFERMLSGTRTSYILIYFWSLLLGLSGKVIANTPAPTSGLIYLLAA